MKISEYYNKIKPLYSKWLDSMTTAVAINESNRISYVKEFLFKMSDEPFNEYDWPALDQIPPEWFFDEVCEIPDVDELWGQIFIYSQNESHEHFEGAIRGIIHDWERTRK